ncbi:MAG: WYL domain-containing protein [Barnesiella sp.]|nr:WYL domain-containing protein [Barnesiella sp.]
MPTNKNAMTRYALIDKMLANRHRAYSIQDITDTLAEKLPEIGQRPVSKRCVEKDLNYLEFDSPFDIEIEEHWVEACDKNDRPYRKRCIRYADPTFSIFKPKLSDDEKTVLSTALDILGRFDGLDNFEWLSDLKSRLDLVEHSPIISISKNILTNSTLIARLFTTIRYNQVISLKYHTFSNNSSKTVTVSPYLIKEYNNRWFLIAAASDTGKILTFPLDRIDDFSLDYRSSYLHAPEDLIERYEDIIGVTFCENSPIEEIIFWVSNKSKDYISTKPIHESQKSIRGEEEFTLRTRFPLLSEGKFFKIKCKENYELIRELTSFGSELIVLSPTSLNASIKLQIECMYRLYQSIDG